MRLAKAMRALAAAVVWSVTLVAALSQARAGDPPPVWKDGWTLNTPGQTRWVSGSSAGSSYFPSVSATPFSSADREPYGFNDFSIGHTLGFGRELGLGNMQATLGVRMAAPLAGNWFTPALDPRRYLGVGPRLGLEGNQPLQSSSWVVEWKVGASILSGDRAFGANAGVVELRLAEFLEQRVVHECRWPARPVVLVRHGVEADARLSRGLFQRFVRESLGHVGG